MHFLNAADCPLLSYIVLVTIPIDITRGHMHIAEHT